MRTLFASALVAALCLLGAPAVSTQSNYSSIMYMDGGLYGPIVVTARTTVYFLWAHTKARTEAWISQGTSGCYTGTKSGNVCIKEHYSSVYGVNSVADAVPYKTGNPYNVGTFNASSKHFYINGSTWTNFENRTQSLTIFPPPNTGCPQSGPYWCGASPIAVAVQGNQYKFSAPEVSFDIDADGDLDTVGWPSQPHKVAFLAYDANGNGIVDNGSELFGNATVAGLSNGFEALAHLAGQAAPLNGDDFLVNTHPFFSRLLLWQDFNRNGFSEAEELRPASDVLVAIGLGATEADDADKAAFDKEGNVFRWEGVAQYVGDKHETINEQNPGATIVDVNGNPVTVYSARPVRSIYDVIVAQ